MPSAVVLSILIHAALFLLAGMLVVFTVVKKEEQKFVPPKAVERPKMKLRKPKVKVKKSTKPKPTTRIVTKSRRASMPDIQLPEMSGMGEGLADGSGGFDMMPDLDEPTLFGDSQTIGNDFIGTFYDLKRDRKGRPIPYSGNEYQDAARRFLNSGWMESSLTRYYKSPKKRYSTTFMVPPTLSALVPAIFGEPETEGIYWVTLYKGSLVHMNRIKFRFMGYGDGAMAIRVDGKVVLAAGWMESRWSGWQSSSADSKKYWMGNGTAVAGDWITLEPGVPLDMEVFMVEGGGHGCFMLAIQEEGVEYPMRTIGGPTFPAFRTAELSRGMLDVIYKSLVPGEVSLTNGPVFCDYEMPETAGTKVAEKSIPPPKVEPDAGSEDSAMRTWTRVDGKTVEAGYIAVIGKSVVLETAGGKQKKLPLAQLSTEDRKYIELANPPVFKIDFSAKTEPVFAVVQGGSSGITIAYDYLAKVRLKQKSAGAYKHELYVEFFAIGEEIHGRRYVLLDYQKSNFTPTAENERSHEFHGKPVTLPNFILDEEHRGEKPHGYLITITDSRGKIIQQASTSKWLSANRESLKQIPVGAYMDKTCTRVFPTGPPRTRY